MSYTNLLSSALPCIKIWDVRIIFFKSPCSINSMNEFVELGAIDVPIT